MSRFEDTVKTIKRSLESYKNLYVQTKNEMFLNKWEAMVILFHEIKPEDFKIETQCVIDKEGEQ